MLTASDIGQLIVRVAPRLRRSGTWAGEPTLTAFFELYFKDFRIDGPSHRWYIRAPQQSSSGTWRKRLLGWLSPADQADDPAGEWRTY